MTAGSLKVVFDTNILISGHFWKGPPYRCMLAIDAGLATLVLSDPILTERRLANLLNRAGSSPPSGTHSHAHVPSRRSDLSFCGSGWRASRLPSVPSALRGLDPRQPLPARRHLSERRPPANAAPWSSRGKNLLRFDSCAGPPAFARASLTQHACACSTPRTT